MRCLTSNQTCRCSKCCSMVSSTRLTIVIAFMMGRKADDKSKIMIAAFRTARSPASRLLVPRHAARLWDAPTLGPRRFRSIYDLARCGFRLCRCRLSDEALTGPLALADALSRRHCTMTGDDE